MDEFVSDVHQPVFKFKNPSSENALDRSCTEVKSVVMASTTVECLSDSSDLGLDIVGIFARDNVMQSEQQGKETSKYFVYAGKAESSSFKLDGLAGDSFWIAHSF